MAEEYKYKYATDVKKLRFNGLLDRSFFGTDNVNEVVRMIYNGKVVFNRAFFELWSENTIELASIGTRHEPLYKVLDVVSRKTDYDGKITEVEFEGAENPILPNETDKIKEGEFTIIQNFSNLQIKGKWTQAARSVASITFKYIESVSVYYDDNISAGGGTVEPRVSVTYVAEYIYDNSTSESNTLTTSGYVSNANGQPQNSSGATINSIGGVYAGNLYGNPEKERDVFSVSSMSGYIRINEIVNSQSVRNDYPWEWTGAVFVRQNENRIIRKGERLYDISSSVNKYRIGGEEQVLEITVSAWEYRDIIWSSLYEDKEWSRTYANILAPSYCELSNDVVYGDDKVYVTIPQNGTTARDIEINVYNMSAGYDVVHTITQDAYEEVEYWGIPMLDGSVSWEIPANGQAVKFTVPVLQYKYKGDTATPYRWTAPVVAVQGHAVEGTGASFSGGYISCDSMGTTTFDNGREAYYAERIWVTGQDDDTHELEFGGNVIIRQAANIYTGTYSSPILTMSYGLIGANGSAAALTLRYSQTFTERWTAVAEPKITPLSGTISNSATTGNRITSVNISGSINGAKVDNTSGSIQRGSVTANSLAYDPQIERNVGTVSVSAIVNDVEGSASCSIRQQANVVETFYDIPIVGSPEFGDVGANGAATSVKVKYIQYYVKRSTANPEGIKVNVAPVAAVTPSSIEGKTEANNGRVSGTSVLADTTGTDPRSRQPVFTLQKVYVKANEQTGYWEGSVSVNQAQNKVEKETAGAYSVSVNTSPSTMVSEGGSITVNVVCLQKVIYTYTSKANKDVDRNAKVTLSAPSYCYGYTTEFEGYGTTSLTIGENIGAARDVVITATAADGKTKATTSVKQNEVRYSFTPTSLQNFRIGDTATLVTITGKSTRNGFSEDINKGDVSFGSYTIGNPAIGTIRNTESGDFTIPVSFSANQSTSEKNLSVIVTQPNSGLKLTFSITQAAKTADVDYIWWQTGSGVYTSGDKVTMRARLVYISSIEGKSVSITPLKGTDSLTNAQTFVLSRNGVSGSNYYMDIELQVRTSVSEGDMFLLRAVYGNDTATIGLAPSSFEPV